MFTFGISNIGILITVWNTVDLGIDCISSGNVYKHQI